MSDALSELARDHDLACRFGDAGWRLTTRQFALAKHLDALTAFYTRCIEGTL
jgi:hypothetical protein